MRHPAPQWSRDMSAMHTPSREEDRADGLGTVDVEEQGNGGIGPSWGRHFMTPVFWISLAVVGVVVGLALVLPQPFYDASGAIRNVISERFGWYYLLLVAMVVLACLFFMIGPTGAIRLGDPTEKPRLHHVVARHAVLGRHGHRPGVLGRRRAAVPLRELVPRGRGRLVRGAPRRVPLLVLPLGHLRVGDLRPRRRRPRLLPLPEEGEDAHLGDAQAPVRRQDERHRREHRRCDHDLRDGRRRRDEPRHGGRADQRRSEPSVRDAQQSRDPVGDHRRRHGPVPRLGAVRPLARGQAPVQSERRPRHRPRGGVHRHRADHEGLRRPRDGDRRLHAELPEHEPVRLPLRHDPPVLDQGLDDLLLVVVDRLVAVRGRLHRAHLAGPLDPAVPAGGHPHPDRLQLHLVRDLRDPLDLGPDQRRRPRLAADRERAVRHARPVPPREAPVDPVGAAHHLVLRDLGRLGDVRPRHDLRGRQPRPAQADEGDLGPPAVRPRRRPAHGRRPRRPAERPHHHGAAVLGHHPAHGARPVPGAEPRTAHDGPVHQADRVPRAGQALPLLRGRSPHRAGGAHAARHRAHAAAAARRGDEAVGDDEEIEPDTAPDAGRT